MIRTRRRIQTLARIALVVSLAAVAYGLHLMDGSAVSGLYVIIGSLSTAVWSTVISNA
jgi:hypothetical protein